MGDSNKRLRQARKAAGFKSSRAAALQFGWPVSTYASHENGQTDPVPTEAAFDYAKAFSASPLWILYGIGLRDSIDAMLIDQPKAVWDHARDAVATVLKHHR